MSSMTDAEKDIIELINKAICEEGLFGYGVVLPQKERIINEELMGYLEPKVKRADYMNIEVIVNKLIDVSEVVGFKRGFHIAMRIMVDGLNTGIVTEVNKKV